VPVAGSGAPRRAIGQLLSSAASDGASARPSDLCEAVAAEDNGNSSGGVIRLELRSSDGEAIESDADWATSLLKAGSHRTIGLAIDTALIKRIFENAPD